MEHRLDFGKITEYRETPDGFLDIFMSFSRVGSLVYQRTDGRLETEYLTEEELFNEDSLATATGKPVTYLHPPEWVNKNNARKYQRGSTGTKIIKDTPFATILATVHDGELIDVIKSGKAKQVSAGYTTKVVKGDDGKLYQTGRVYNHMAIVPLGRAGDKVKVHYDGVDDIALLVCDDATPVKKEVSMHDLQIGLQYEKGDTRHGKPLPVGYGHIRKHYGADGMSLDVYLGSNLDSEKVFRVKQLTQDGEFDEEKIFLGFDSLEEAQNTYLAVMPQEMFGGIEEISLEDLRSAQKKDTEKVATKTITMTITELRIDDQTTIKIGSSEGEQAIAKYFKDALDANKALTSQLAQANEKAAKVDKLSTDLQSAQTERDQQKARADVAESKLNEVKTEQDKKTDDGAVKAAFDQGYQRHVLEVTAVKFLPSEMKIDSAMPDKDIKLAVIKHQLKLKADSDEAKHYDAESEAYINAAYRIIANQDSSTLLKVSATDAKPEEKQDAAEMARAKFIERMKRKKKRGAEMVAT